MLCTVYFDVVTAVCQLLINGYVMLCYVIAQAVRPTHGRTGTKTIMPWFLLRRVAVAIFGLMVSLE